MVSASRAFFVCHSPDSILYSKPRLFVSFRLGNIVTIRSKTTGRCCPADSRKTIPSSHRQRTELPQKRPAASDWQEATAASSRL